MIRAGAALARAGLLCAGALAALVVGEALVRAVPGVLPPHRLQQVRPVPTLEKLTVRHPTIGYLWRPHFTAAFPVDDPPRAYHTDGHGFRNTWPWPENADVVALGDSFTFGYGVADDDSWPARLQQALVPLRVVNLGLPGGAPQQYLRIHEAFGVRLAPRLLLVGFTSNDFDDAVIFDRWLRAGATEDYRLWAVGIAGRPQGLTFAAAVDVVRRRSYLYHLVFEGRDALMRWWRGEPKVVTVSDGTQVRLAPSWADRQREAGRPEHVGFQIVLQAYAELAALARAHGARMLVVVYPSKEDTYLPLLGIEQDDLTGPLRRALAAREIATLDLTPAFRRHAAAGESLFFASDSHMNPQGQALIVREVTKLIEGERDRFGLGARTPARPAVPADLTHRGSAPPRTP